MNTRLLIIGAIVAVLLLVLMTRTCSAPANRGEELYQTHCGTCHGSQGEGYRMYPPLTDAEYLEDHRSQFACWVYYGMHESIVVNGETYKGRMPGNPALTENDIANIANFVYNSWGNPGGMFTTQSIQQDLENCPD